MQMIEAPLMPSRFESPGPPLVRVISLDAAVSAPPTPNVDRNPQQLRKDPSGSPKGWEEVRVPFRTWRGSWPPPSPHQIDVPSMRTQPYGADALSHPWTNLSGRFPRRPCTGLFLDREPWTNRMNQTIAVPFGNTAPATVPPSPSVSDCSVNLFNGQENAISDKDRENKVYRRLGKLSMQVCCGAPPDHLRARLPSSLTHRSRRYRSRAAARGESDPAGESDLNEYVSATENQTSDPLPISPVTAVPDSPPSPNEVLGANDQHDRLDDQPLNLNVWDAEAPATSTPASPHRSDGACGPSELRFVRPVAGWHPHQEQEFLPNAMAAPVVAPHKRKHHPNVPVLKDIPLELEWFKNQCIWSKRLGRRFCLNCGVEDAPSWHSIPENEFGILEIAEGWHTYFNAQRSRNHRRQLLRVRCNACWKYSNRNQGQQRPPRLWSSSDHDRLLGMHCLASRTKLQANPQSVTVDDQMQVARILLSMPEHILVPSPGPSRRLRSGIEPTTSTGAYALLPEEPDPYGSRAPRRGVPPRLHRENYVLYPPDKKGKSPAPSFMSALDFPDRTP